MKTRNWFILIGLFLVFTILVIRPVPIPVPKDCLSLTGTVSEIYEAGTKDAVFKLQGLEEKYYINRALERGLDLENLRADLVGKEIVILYPKYWTPLDPFNSVRHVSKVEYDGKTV